MIRGMKRYFAPDVTVKFQHVSRDFVELLVDTVYHTDGIAMRIPGFVLTPDSDGTSALALGAVHPVLPVTFRVCVIEDPTRPFILPPRLLELVFGYWTFDIIAELIQSRAPPYRSVVASHLSVALKGYVTHAPVTQSDWGLGTTQMVMAPLSSRIGRRPDDVAVFDVPRRLYHVQGFRDSADNDATFGPTSTTYFDGISVVSETRYTDPLPRTRWSCERAARIQMLLKYACESVGREKLSVPFGNARRVAVHGIELCREISNFVKPNRHFDTRPGYTETPRNHRRRRRKKRP